MVTTIKQNDEVEPNKGILTSQDSSIAKDTRPWRAGQIDRYRTQAKTCLSVSVTYLVKTSAETQAKGYC